MPSSQTAEILIFSPRTFVICVPFLIFISYISSSLCLFCIFLQEKNPYISLNKNITKQATIGRYEILSSDASAHRIISTISFKEYTSAKYGLLINVRKEAIKLVVIDTVLHMRLGVDSA